MKNKNAILYPNAESDTGFKMAQHTADLLEKNGWKTTLCAYPSIPTLANAQVLITFGGDGTILHAARAVADLSIPILGVNMGGKGFIAELEPDDLELINKVVTGDYGLETRMMVDIEVRREGKVVHRDFALNDAVIKGDNKVIEMAVLADGQKIIHFAGDGIIAATPTGSTAYSMSAGGPIVEPSAKNIIITPICAHILEAKSFVLTAKSVVTIETLHKKDISAYLSVDGGDHFDILRGDSVSIRKSKKSANLVHLSGKSFYHRVSEKLTSRMN